MKRHRPRTEDFLLGWICPLPLEYAAAKAVLDELYDEAEYATGRIHNHDLVITCLPAGQMGTNAAAAATERLRAAFPSLKHAVLVGIAGGVPSSKAQVQLGDVVVGQPDGQYGGVVQYDFGKTLPCGFQRTGFLNAPSPELLTAVARFKSNIEAATTSIRARTASLVPSQPDILFHPSYNHPGGDNCDSCRKDLIVKRQLRSDGIGIFFGTIASGNQVIKDGATRDKGNSDLGGVLCFEMEAAGVVNLIPCLVIRGICDYADSHKNKVFQPLAAAAAAQCARQILSYIPCANVEEAEIPAQGQAHLSSELRDHLLDSLNFDQLDSRHNSIRRAHLKTCRWLLSTQEYKAWLDEDQLDQHHGVFWIKGKPGAGKSTLMKFAFAQATASWKDRTVISFFFNARGDILEKSVIGMYRSLLFQLFTAMPDMQSVFDSLRIKNGQAPDWTLEQLKSLFTAAIQKLENRPLVCFIDALDECDEDKVRDMLSFFEQLGQLALSHKARLLVCLSSRHYPHITIRNKIELVLENEQGHQQDIANYVYSELKAGNSKLVQEIRTEIIDRASGIFLWVILVVQILNKEYDRGHIHALRRRLKDIPDGLHSLLKDILMRGNHDIGKTLLCLQWILYAKRPLTRDELYFAILAGTDLDPVFLSTWTAEDVTEEEQSIFVLDASKGLAEVTKSKKAPTVQFIHESVRDFLRDGGLNDLALGSIAPGPSHESLKSSCLAYVAVDISSHWPQSDELPSSKTAEARSLRASISQRYPFLEYAVANVLYHANKAAEYEIDQEHFLKGFPTDTWAFKNNLFEKHQTRRYSAAVDTLYILADRNMLNLIPFQTKLGIFVLSTQERYKDPFHAAMMNRNTAAVRVLLACHATSLSLLDHQYYKGKSFLLLAAERGDVDMVKLLLEFGANSARDSAPLLAAVKYRHHEVAELLLDHQPDLASKQTSVLTALHHAVQSEHCDHPATIVGLLKLLLGRCAFTEERGDLGMTPLPHAARDDSPATIELLLDGIASLEAKDNQEGTPLSHAVLCRREILQILLRRDAVLETRDKYGQTPLAIAANHNHYEVVELLLAHGAFLETRDNQGRTPLSIAAQDNRYKMVEFLLAQGAHLEAGDDQGRTPLSHAAALNYYEMVEVLLAQGALLETRDRDGRTPLYLAAQCNYYEMAVLLVAGGALLETRNDYGWTPLSIAAHFNCCEMVEFLLAQGAVLETRNDYGWTPLFCAVEQDNCEIVEVLLAQGALLETRDNQGRTPLLVAMERNPFSFERDKMVELLLARGALLETRDNQGRTPLSHAAGQCHLKFVKSLLDHGAEIDTKDNLQRTPLWYVGRQGHTGDWVEIKKLLLDRGAKAEEEDFNGIPALYPSDPALLEYRCHDSRGLSC